MALDSQLRDLFEANRVTQIGNRLGGGENDHFREWLAGACLVALGLDDLDAAAERLAASIPHHSFISQDAWEDCNDHQRQRRLTMARKALSRLLATDSIHPSADNPEGDKATEGAER